MNEKHDVDSSMSDKELFELCRKYGEAALSARRKFAGLLPEVFRRRLYEKKGYSSIFEFAARLAGMSREQVSLVLRLEERFADKPTLKEALVSGTVSVNKLGRVASIATVENEVDLGEKVKMFSNRAIEVFVKDVKNKKAEIGEIESVNGSQEPLFGGESLHVQTEKAVLKLDEDIEKELLEMQEKGIDINQFLREALKMRKEGIEERKEEIVKGQELREENMVNSSRDYKKAESNRYIPIAIKKVIREEYGTKCSYPGCMKDARVLHHTQRFALARVHDPRFIAPLCAAHHEIAHKIDVKFAQKAIVA